jgi:tricorn protease-like protein
VALRGYTGAMLSRFLACLCLAGGLFVQKPYFTEPSVSPNRPEIVFVSGGDIWSAPLAGGEARLLVANPANESRPMYSPDGSRLAFVSNRTGNGDLYAP